MPSQTALHLRHTHVPQPVDVNVIQTDANEEAFEGCAVRYAI